MNQQLEDKRTLKHLREQWKDERIYNNDEKARDFKNILLLYYHKYSDYLNVKHIQVPSHIDKDTWVCWADVIINNI